MLKLGIDFGTCYSSAALLIEGVPTPINAPLTPGYCLPSSVFITEQGEILVGQAAENNQQKNPLSYRREFKRDLGSTDPYTFGTTYMLPEELITEIIKKLKGEAEKVAQGRGEKPLTEALITVPATYGKYKRDLMQEAGQKAGFSQIQLLEEPVAAAIYYSHHAQIKDGDIILVYDLGGGTFDATLMQKQGDKYQVLGMPKGLSHCGGKDFDRLIFQQLKNSCSAELRQQLEQKNAWLARAIVGNLCRDLKHQLSEQSEASIYIPMGLGQMESFELTSEAFNEMIAPLIEETLDCCEQLVRSAKKDWTQVNRLLLVGGSSRIPYVKEAIEKRLEISPFLVDKPELAVCLGAAMNDSNEDIIQTLLNSGDALYEQGKLEEAIAKYQEAISLDSNHIVARHKLEIAEQTLKERLENERKRREEENQRIESARLEAEIRAKTEAELKLKQTEKVKISPKPIELLDKKRKQNFGECIQTLKGHNGWYAGVQSVSFSPDETMIASASDDKTIKVWNVVNGRENYTLQGYTNCVKSVVFSPDGLFIAGGSIGTIKIWHTSSQQEIITLKGHQDWIYSLAFSSDGQFLASGSADKTIRIWRVKDWQEIYQLKGHTGIIHNIAFNPNKLNLISGSLDKTIKLWNVELGTELHTIKAHNNATIYAVAFSGDGKYFATGSFDKTIKIWNANTKQEFLTLRGHSELIYALAFNPIHPYLASGSVDNTIKLWRLNDGQQLCTLKGHGHRITSLVFSSDGNLLATGSDDQTVKIWQVGPL